MTDRCDRCFLLFVGVVAGRFFVLEAIYQQTTETTERIVEPPHVPDANQMWIKTGVTSNAMPSLLELRRFACDNDKNAFSTYLR